MERRQFLKKTTLIGGAALLFPVSGCVHKNKDTFYSDKDFGIHEKVKSAMLSMQRASWEQGVASQAFLESGDMEMTCLMAKEAILRQTVEGRLSVLYTDNGVTDPAASGQALIYAYQHSGDTDFNEAAGRMRDFLLTTTHKTTDGILHHTINAPEIWSDSLYMAPPFLAAAEQYEESVKQIRGMRSVLWNNEKKLLSHRWDTVKKEYIDQRFWGGGNGWAAAGMSRVIELLPDTFLSEKEELIGYVSTLIDSCLQYLRLDGLFHNFLDDPDSFVETNVSQMLSYSIFKGIYHGWLDNTYARPAMQMRQAAWRKVDTYGYVQDACGAPFFDKPGRSTEAQAFFMMMEAAYRNWENRKKK